MRQPRHLANRHHRARFVVDHHDADENGIGPQRGPERVQRDCARFIRLQVRHVKAARFELLYWVQNGMVLDGRGDDVLAALAKALGG